jgi:hypothetical protein
VTTDVPSYIKIKSIWSVLGLRPREIFLNCLHVKRIVNFPLENEVRMNWLADTFNNVLATYWNM